MRPHRLLPDITNTNERIILMTVLAFTAAGAVAGLIIGSVTYLPTAPVAVIEAGIPSAMLGLIFGLLGTGVHILWEKARQH